MQTDWDLKKKLLDEHGDLYRKFTTLILSFSTGAIGLLIAFRSSWIKTTDTYVVLAKVGLALLLVSFIAGIIVQHSNMLRPLAITRRVDRLAKEAEEKESSDPVEVRREPDVKERIAYKIQIWSFYVAVVIVVIYVLINVNS